MIKEDYITKYTAELLYECGCKDTHNAIITQAQALRWLRDELDIYIILYPSHPKLHLWFSRVNKRINALYMECVHGKDYEEAMEEAIQEFCKKLIEKRKNMKQYIKPDILAHKLTPVSILSASRTGCDCGCPKSDVWTGACGCNNGRGCPSCGADHGGGIVGGNFTRKISSVEDEVPYE